MMIFNIVQNTIHVAFDKDNKDRDYAIRKNKVIFEAMHSKNAKKINDNNYYFHSLTNDDRIKLVSFLGKVLKCDINDQFFDNIRKW